jgi:hypothetical protein
MFLRNIHLCSKTNKCSLTKYAPSNINIDLHTLITFVTLIRVLYKNTDKI